ncbi:hypothetical protein CTAM01_17324 [Colletotrichum tamarilloi]|uniref:Uncharacterized protein n=1 Tax=Colletotrichum tamarilloi TaxID=1209934 RepID=A0ABQ9QFX9_9PEZI|nr:uncharacterized protein CTAM01_17324 [Colletotrichum tamarilloi]KAK1450595.1 hypothetical protein CTAM01_17324 [Colletotrichum tamarilloi]
MGDMLVLVSAADATRDVLYDLAGGFRMDENHPLFSEFQRREDMRQYLRTNVWLRELDYQPAG